MKRTGTGKHSFMLALGILIAVPIWAEQVSSQEKQAPPPGGPAKPFTVPHKEEFSLPNGLKVTMVPYGNLPKVAMAVVVRAGGLNEAADQVSISDITARMLAEGGTASKTAEQVAQEAAAMGGAIRVNAGPDETQAAADVLSEFGPRMVGLLADVVQRPLLPEKELPRLKKDALRNLSIRKARSQTQAFERFMKTVYPDHPYGRVLPTEEMIEKFSIADVQKFYKSNFGAARTHIYVAGKFDAAAMKKAITQGFSQWSQGPGPLIDVPKPSTKRAFEFIDRPNAVQSTIYLGLPTIDPSNADFTRLEVTDTLLGGSFGSRITANIREQKGYTYSPGSFLSPRYRDAYWAEVADVTTTATGPSIKEILSEIGRLQKEPPSDAELQGTKDYMVGTFIMQNSGRQGIIGQLIYVDLHGLGDKYLDTYIQSISSVTASQVQDVTKKYITPERLTIVVVGDKSKIADQIVPYQNSAQ